jgi:hypothetical protein
MSLYFCAFSFVGVSVILSKCLNIPFSYFTRDPLAITGSPPFYGLISNFGAILWSFSVGICFFTYSLLKERNNTQENISLFVFFSGTISAILLVDDMFLFHEKVFPKLLFINEKIVFSLYGLIILYYLIRFRDVILKRTNYLFLMLSLAFFFISICIDQLPEFSTKWHHLFEDTPKFLGIVSWTGFHYLVCKKMVI